MCGPARHVPCAPKGTSHSGPGLMIMSIHLCVTKRAAVIRSKCFFGLRRIPYPSCGQGRRPCRTQRATSLGLPVEKHWSLLAHGSHRPDDRALDQVLPTGHGQPSDASGEPVEKPFRAVSMTRVEIAPCTTNRLDFCSSPRCSCQASSPMITPSLRSRSCCTLATRMTKRR